jgi:hypothetical protein
MNFPDMDGAFLMLAVVTAIVGYVIIRSLEAIFIG